MSEHEPPRRGRDDGDDVDDAGEGGDVVEGEGEGEAETPDIAWVDPLLELRNLEHRSVSELGIELDAPVHRRRRWVLALVVLAAVGVAAYLAFGRSDGGSKLTDLASGDCYSPAVDRATDAVTRRSCTEAHAAELVNFYRDPSASAGAYPGHGELIVYTQSACVQRVIELAGTSVDALVKRGLVLKAAVPDEAQWADGERGMACSVVDVRGRDLRAPVLTHRGG